MSANDRMEIFDDDSRFDLLVDGELSEAERRELLASLDDEPNGWRRCALAFLEAQAWKDPLADLIRPAAGVPKEERDAPTPRQPSHRPAARPLGRFWVGGHGGTVLAMAASFLVALYLGTLVQQGRQPSSPAVPGATGVGGTTEIAHVMGAPPQRNSPSIPKPRDRQPADSVSPKWQMVTVSGGKDAQGNPRLFRFPAIERDQLDESWFSETATPLPDELARALKQQGNKDVQRRRYLIPFRLKDGRRLVVPVDEVDVQYRKTIPQ